METIDKKSNRDLANAEANAFALCILMPRERFRAAWYFYSADTLALAGHFNVITQHVEVRAQMLNLTYESASLDLEYQEYLRLKSLFELPRT